MVPGGALGCFGFDEAVAVERPVVLGGGVKAEHPLIGGSHYDGAEREAARQTVNEWIRNSGAFDAVIDFDAVLRDPARPARLMPAADTGDNLHPNETGYRIMADAIDLALFVP